MKFKINLTRSPTTNDDRQTAIANPGFGRLFTDHMAVMNYDQVQGWIDPRIEARANFVMGLVRAIR